MAAPFKLNHICRHIWYVPYLGLTNFYHRPDLQLPPQWN